MARPNSELTAAIVHSLYHRTPWTALYSASTASSFSSQASPIRTAPFRRSRSSMSPFREEGNSPTDPSRYSL
jgi:hypothetical protein